MTSTPSQNARIRVLELQSELMRAVNGYLETHDGTTVEEILLALANLQADQCRLLIRGQETPAKAPPVEGP